MRLIFLTLITICTQLQTFAQQTESSTNSEYSITSGSFLLPQRLPSGKYTHAIYLQYVVPPKDWTLDAVLAPMFNYTGKYALPMGFNVQGGLSTLIVANRFFVGPYWNYVAGKFHFAAGYQIAFNYGFLGTFGFDTVLTGWEHQPSLTAGYNFGKTALTIRGDLYYTTSINFSEGGNTISNKDPFVNGVSLQAGFEQRLTKNRVMSLGFRMNYLRYHIIAWPALPVNSYRYFMPEFIVGLNF